MGCSIAFSHFLISVVLTYCCVCNWTFPCNGDGKPLAVVVRSLSILISQAIFFNSVILCAMVFVNLFMPLLYIYTPNPKIVVTQKNDKEATYFLFHTS
jgi:hypothetical protein